MAASDEFIWHRKHYTGRGVMEYYASGAESRGGYVIAWVTSRSTCAPASLLQMARPLLVSTLRASLREASLVTSALTATRCSNVPQVLAIVSIRILQNDGTPMTGLSGLPEQILVSLLAATLDGIVQRYVYFDKTVNDWSSDEKHQLLHRHMHRHRMLRQDYMQRAHMWRWVNEQIGHGRH
jgi:hypothetical protein